MDKVKEAINKMREEYRGRIGELLTEEYEFNEGSVDTVSALSNAHSLEAGVHTLNTLERILDDREYASKEWGLEYIEINPPLKCLSEYEILRSGSILLKGTDVETFIPNSLLNRIIDDLDELGLIADKPFPLIGDYKINDAAEIVVNTTLGVFHIPPHLFNKMIYEAIKEGYLSYSINLHKLNSGDYVESLEFKMKPKTEEEEED